MSSNMTSGVEQLRNELLTGTQIMATNYVSTAINLSSVTFSQIWVEVTISKHIPDNTIFFWKSQVDVQKNTKITYTSVATELSTASSLGTRVFWHLVLHNDRLTWAFGQGTRCHGGGGGSSARFMNWDRPLQFKQTCHTRIDAYQIAMVDCPDIIHSSVKLHTHIPSMFCP